MTGRQLQPTTTDAGRGVVPTSTQRCSAVVAIAAILAYACVSGDELVRSWARVSEHREGQGCQRQGRDPVRVLAFVED